MEAYVLEWLSLIGRWAHLITGIAWIGASFYFVWLDNHLEAPAEEADRARGVGGELWAVHGGGFYHAQKYSVSPPSLPPRLHWFKWEAYTTWITGVFLLALLYWYQAEIYLLDPAVMTLSKPVAIALGVATLVLGWIGYDRLCRSGLGQNERLMAIAMLVLLSLVAWGLCQVFSGRGAYIHFGAMLGSIMVANVAFVIMPAQRKLVAASEAGEQPEASHGQHAKQRSVHNTYFTLPVLFVMISNHYAMLWSHRLNWLILIALCLAGALIRVHFVQRHFGRPSPFPAASAAALLIAVVLVIAPPMGTSGPSVALADAHAVVETRCTACHANQPEHPGFSAAPKGIILETPEQTRTQAAAIHQQTVVTRAMPIGNLTGISDEERALIDRWFQGLQQ